jgi:hypothetical protein
MKSRGLVTLSMVLLGAALLLTIGGAFADDNGNKKFRLFGDAKNLTGGLPPNGSVHLTSHCDPYDPVSNPAPCSFIVTFSGIDYTPKNNLLFNQITRLSSDFNVDGGDCGGGSPRFQINIDTGCDGSVNGNIFVAFGPSPNFTQCALGWQNTGNLIGNNDTGRYDSGQVGGSVFGTYNDALVAAGNSCVLGIQLVVDGGWFASRGQAVDVDNFRVNNDVLKGNVGGNNDD